MLFSHWLFEPFLFIFRPEKRIFLGYLLSAFVIAFIVLKIQTGKPPRDLLRMLFDKRLWLHKSSMTDYKLLLFNTLLKGFLFSLIVISSFAVAREVLVSFQDLFPGFIRLQMSSFSQAIIYTACSFVLLDFSRFLQHYCMHRFEFLWRFHQVHHSARVLTPFTLYRTHPVESLLSSFRRVLVIGFSTGFFVFLFGAKMSAFDIIGINIIDFVFNFMASNLRHSHVWLSFGPLSYIFISPAQHQVHHSQNPKYFGKNLGIVLSLWDQLFGTFYYPKKKEFLRFGLPGEGVWSFKQALLKPFALKKLKDTF